MADNDRNADRDGAAVDDAPSSTERRSLWSRLDDVLCGMSGGVKDILDTEAKHDRLRYRVLGIALLAPLLIGWAGGTAIIAITTGMPTLKAAMLGWPLGFIVAWLIDPALMTARRKKPGATSTVGKAGRSFGGMFAALPPLVLRLALALSSAIFIGEPLLSVVYDEAVIDAYNDRTVVELREELDILEDDVEDADVARERVVSVSQAARDTAEAEFDAEIVRLTAVVSTAQQAVDATVEACRLEKQGEFSDAGRGVGPIARAICGDDLDVAIGLRNAAQQQLNNQLFTQNQRGLAAQEAAAGDTGVETTRSDIIIEEAPEDGQPLEQQPATDPAATDPAATDPAATDASDPFSAAAIAERVAPIPPPVLQTLDIQVAGLADLEGRRSVIDEQITILLGPNPQDSGLHVDDISEIGLADRVRLVYVAVPHLTHIAGIALVALAETAPLLVKIFWPATTHDVVLGRRHARVEREAELEALDHQAKIHAMPNAERAAELDQIEHDARKEWLKDHLKDHGDDYFTAELAERFRTSRDPRTDGPQPPVGSPTPPRPSPQPDPDPSTPQDPKDDDLATAETMSVGGYVVALDGETHAGGMGKVARGRYVGASPVHGEGFVAVKTPLHKGQEADE